jgi:transcription-repair coupling factor (superfamily II helicase)
MLGTLSIYLRFFTEADIFIQDYAPDSTVFIYDEPSFLLNDQNLKAELQAYHEKMHGNAFMGLQVQAPYQPKAEYRYFDIDAPTEVGLLTKPLNGGLSGLTRYLVEYLGQTVVLANPEPLIRQQIAQILDQAQFPYHENEFTPQSINLLDADYQVSFHDYRHQLVLIGPELYQQKTVKSRQVYRSVINQASKIHDVNEIKVGDYVVHFQYGIAKYLGITTMELSYGVADYLILEFSEEKQLYVLVDHLDQILKYVSYNGFEPKLSKLYSSGWTKTKFETIKKIKELSDKLLSLYARRNLVKRPPYVDVDLVNEVANTFEYDETPDQLKAIHEMQQDLSSEHPMDRLIIGDVGFGKTEVALRGAYRAVLSGKQVVYLVPTTVLARQHYLLFRQRLDPFGVKTVLYTRLVGAREQHEIEESLADGYCDIVIGTHKLLNEKMSYHQLGMMIIDEEQRFGVAQKIKINQLRPSLDVLSLSATPIPRTLQRSLVGVMDFSLIETPPTNRYPVQTYLLEEDDTITKGAILREMARGGQIFFLSNNTHRMELVMEQLKKLVPECRMTAIHGQMDKEDIEDRLSKFIDQEYDLLVSTTIIETGMDIPNANTLIVRNADRLGLAQMYQLRGRVGRSNKLAYAYFYYDKKQILSNASQLRLKSSEEFTELGSGYKIAYRDLSIRGAGDLLGSEQSGFIDSVGIELYNKLLQSTISQTPLEFNQERQNEPKYSSHSIASQYIKDDGVRLQIHQRIAKLGSLEEAKTMKEELTDRFGAISSNLNNYIDEIVYQKLLHRVGSSKVLVSQSQIEVNFSNDEQHRLDTKKMKEISRRWGNEADFVFIFGQYRLTLKHHGLDKSWMNQISGILEVYLDERTNILPS